VVQSSTARCTQGRDGHSRHTHASTDHTNACERSTGAQEHKNVAKTCMLKKSVGIATNAGGQTRQRKYPFIPLPTWTRVLEPASRGRGKVLCLCGHAHVRAAIRCASFVFLLCVAVAAPHLCARRARRALRAQRAAFKAGAPLWAYPLPLNSCGVGVCWSATGLRRGRQGQIPQCSSALLLLLYRGFRPGS
jgi:hypothetical protein